MPRRQCRVHHICARVFFIIIILLGNSGIGLPFGFMQQLQVYLTKQLLCRKISDVHVTANNNKEKGKCSKMKEKSHFSNLVNIKISRSTLMNTKSLSVLIFGEIRG